jgi:hypothetical protein
MEVSAQGETETAEESYRKALLDASSYATTRNPQFRVAATDDVAAAAPDDEHPVAPGDGLGAKLGAKPKDRPKVAFEAGPTETDLNAAEALYREALGEAMGYVKTTKPPKQRPADKPPSDDSDLGAYCDPAMQAQADARRAAVAQAAVDAAEAKAEAEANWRAPWRKWKSLRR